MLPIDNATHASKVFQSKLIARSYARIYAAQFHRDILIFCEHSEKGRAKTFVTVPLPMHVEAGILTEYITPSEVLPVIQEQTADDVDFAPFYAMITEGLKDIDMVGLPNPAAPPSRRWRRMARNLHRIAARLDLTQHKLYVLPSDTTGPRTRPAGFNTFIGRITLQNHKQLAMFACWEKLPQSRPMFLGQ